MRLSDGLQRQIGQTMWTILVSEPLNDEPLAYLAAHGRVIRCGPEEVAAHIADADALIVRTYTQVDEALLEAAERLKVVGRAGVALDNIDVAACGKRGIEVVHTPAANTLAVVDYTIHQIIEMNRRFWPMEEATTPEAFHAARKQSFGRFLAEMTLGIVGCGRIGSRVGRAAAGLGMTVLYNDIRPIELDYPAREVDKPTLYAESDVVTLHVPLTDLTTRLIDADALKQFKPGSQLINAARGGCVNAFDVAAALQKGQLSAVAIDCHDPEPPPADYPLFGLAGAILTPHVAARVPAAMAAMCDVVYDVVRVLAGQSPEYPAPQD
ncbi:hypothetical protein LCGC14_0276400 [marine sediment metagenome]|uniref:Phosphoglycerate dehydrogenase n=1 Tax=marine sediment metagenome TaxID=412755 RepID=A0A0F9UE50_9ZZZZ|nr:phosphoglycerate dehydrogenase [Phycisphaerae bacterium]HDZ43913.1 phosphoglycerate dehydrogenase [Phycisphaerae bacterium]